MPCVTIQSVIFCFLYQYPLNTSSTVLESDFVIFTKFQTVFLPQCHVSEYTIWCDKATMCSTFYQLCFVSSVVPTAFSPYWVQPWPWLLTTSFHKKTSGIILWGVIFRELLKHWKIFTKCLPNVYQIFTKCLPNVYQMFFSVCYIHVWCLPEYSLARLYMREHSNTLLEYVVIGLHTGVTVCTHMYMYLCIRSSWWCTCIMHRWWLTDIMPKKANHVSELTQTSIQVQYTV